MIERLYIIGAIAVARNFSLACKMPLIIPEMPKNIGEIIINLVRFIAFCCISFVFPVDSPSPGAISGINSGAKMNAIVAKIKESNAIRLSTLEASCHASIGPDSKCTLLNTGINAAESVAPAISWKTRSGMRKATQ